MKILFLHKNLALGGGERIILNLAKASRQNNQVLDIAILENRVEFEDLEHLKIIPLTSFPKLDKIFRFLYSPIILVKLLLVAKNYDLIISFERYFAYLNFIASKILKKKFVIYIINPIELTLKEIFPGRLLSSFHLFLHKVIFLRANLLLVLSEGLKKEIVDAFDIPEKKIVVVEGSFNKQEIDGLSKEKVLKDELDIFKNKKVVISVGRLHFQKDFGLLISSFEKVAEEIKNSILLIIGEGEERGKLEALVKDLGIEERVFLLGARTNPFKYLARSDIFVLTSKFEGFGNVLLEALYCKIPIVTLYSPPELTAAGSISFLKSQNFRLKGCYLSKGMLIIKDKKDKNKKNLLSASLIWLLKNRSLLESLSKGERKKSLEFEIRNIYQKFIRVIGKIENNV